MSRRVFLFIGAKGGSGTTSIAHAVASRLPQPPVVVDGDLGGSRSHAISLDVVAKLDESRLPGIPSVATTPQLTLLELAQSYEDGFAVQTNDVEAILEHLPADGTFIVDTPQPFAAAVQPFVKRAILNVIVAEPTLLGIGGARQRLLAMQRFGIPVSRIALVINNRNESERGFKKGDVQNLLALPLIGDLPAISDRGYDRAVRALVANLEKVPYLEPLPNLRAPATTPVGDRRAGAGRAGSASKTGSDGVSSPVPARSEESAAYDERKAQLHTQLMSRIDFTMASRAHADDAKMSELKAQVNEIVMQLIAERRDLGTVEETALLKQEIVEEALGFGAIESLLHDPMVSEIMVNGARNIYIERRGKIERTTKRFVDDSQVRLVIERIIAPLGRRIDESSPMVDARLPDGSRVNAIIAPLAIDGPTLTIRRFGTRRFKASDLVNVGASTQPMIDFLAACVMARLNVVVSGGTGSGKTTLLNAASSFIPATDRIITIEDAAELLLDQPHVIRLESRPPNIEGRGEIKIRDLLRNSLRMRPDRIIVGECRGAEALDMLQAMNTGHDGSLTTVHANSCRDALSRIETMVMMAGFDLPVRAIREQVSSAINIIVQVSRFSDGSRKMTSISEVIGMEGDIVTMQEIARYRQRGIDAQGAVIGAFEATGVQPAALDRFAEMGIPFEMSGLMPNLSAVPAWSR